MSRLIFWQCSFAFVDWELVIPSSLSKVIPFFFVISKCHIAIGFISLSIGIIKYLLCKSINVSFTDLSFFAELKSTALLLWYLVPFQMNFLNLLLFMIRRSPVKICTWSLSMKGDLAQSDGGNYRLEITESKVNILERIGFLRV